MTDRAPVQADEQTMTGTQFNVGQTYSTRSMTDYDCIFSFTIHSRTAKTVQVTVRGKQVTRRLAVYQGIENFHPFGKYSMCATVYADGKDLSEATT